VSVAAMTYHIPVLIEQVLDGLAVRPGGTYVDCTVGEGGHTKAILEASRPEGFVLGIDLDPDAISASSENLRADHGSFVLVNDNFSDMGRIAKENGLSAVDGILLDLGMSSLQLQGGGRGFTFLREEPLDMRFDTTQLLTAFDVVNDYRESDIANIIWKYGEEPRSRRIAHAIVANRPVVTSLQLADLVRRALRRTGGRIHPATRTFQAIRIEVNGEMDRLNVALRESMALLGDGGRLAVISYHSLEDRLVKEFLRREGKGAGQFKVITKKVISPSREEVLINSRSRSARLRVAERIWEVNPPVDHGMVWG